MFFFEIKNFVLCDEIKRKKNLDKTQKHYQSSIFYINEK